MNKLCDIEKVKWSAPTQTQKTYAKNSQTIIRKRMEKYDGAP